MDIVSLQSALVGLGVGSDEDRIIGTKESGPSGIDAVISYNSLSLNVRSWVDTFVVNNLDGLDDADVRDSREPNPSGHGETLGPAWYGGRTIGLGGYIQTMTLWKLRDMQLALRQAFADLTQERALTFHAANPNYDLSLFCKKSQKIQMAERQTTENYYKREFLIMLRATNPRFVSRVLEYETTTELDGSFDGIAFSAVNRGNFPSQPIWVIKGPFTTLAIVNDLTGEAIELRNPVPEGETWVIDVTSRRFYREADQELLFGSLAPISTLFEFVRGSNPIRMILAGAVAPSSQVEVRWRHTYM